MEEYIDRTASPAETAAVEYDVGDQLNYSVCLEQTEGEKRHTQSEEWKENVRWLAPDVIGRRAEKFTFCRRSFVVCAAAADAN